MPDAVAIQRSYYAVAETYDKNHGGDEGYWLKRRGRGYIISDGDGISYSYSVFNDWKQIRAASCNIQLLSTSDMKSPWSAIAY
jgi:hypothetical protein